MLFLIHFLIHYNSNKKHEHVHTHTHEKKDEIHLVIQILLMSRKTHQKSIFAHILRIRIIFVVKILNEFFYFKAEFLIEYNRWTICCHVECYIKIWIFLFIFR